MSFTGKSWSKPARENDFFPKKANLCVINTYSHVLEIFQKKLCAFTYCCSIEMKYSALCIFLSLQKIPEVFDEQQLQRNIDGIISKLLGTHLKISFYHVYDWNVADNDMVTLVF